MGAPKPLPATQGKSHNMAVEASEQFVAVPEPAVQRHHSTSSKHVLQAELSEAKLVEHFGSSEPREITRTINAMGQKELQVST